MQNELMKKILPNAWTANWKETDWNFARCPSHEPAAGQFPQVHRGVRGIDLRRSNTCFTSFEERA